MSSRSALQEWSDCCLLMQPCRAGGGKWRLRNTLSQPEDPRKRQFSGLEIKGLGSSVDSLANDPLAQPGPLLSWPQFPSLHDVGVSKPVCTSAQLHSL